MKKEVKRQSIGKRLLALVCTFAMVVCMVPAIHANAEGGATGGLLLDKNIVLQDDGSYKITMEAFATGSTLPVQREVAPLDIVLVLDQSGSMAKKDIEISTSYKVGIGAGAKVSNIARSETQYYVLEDGKYYPLSKKVEYDQDYYSKYTLSYTVGGITKYLANKVNGNTKTTQALYVKDKTENAIRLDVLKEAAENFVQGVEAAAKEQQKEDPKFFHRIGITGFSSEDYYNTEFLTGCGIESKKTVGMHWGDGSRYYPDYGVESWVEYYFKKVGQQYDSNRLRNQKYKSAAADNLKDVTTKSGKESIKVAIEALTAEGATRTDHGMQMAHDVFTSYDNAGDNKYTDSKGNLRSRQKVVILFTDGVPTKSNTFNTTVADDAISEANAMKKDQNALIYSIGVMENADPSDTSTDVNKFMNYISSNYKNATSLTDWWATKVEGGDFYKTAKDAEELNAIFTEITQEVGGGSSAHTTLDESAVLKDTISQYFNIAGSESIKAYTVDGMLENESIVWDESTKKQLGTAKIDLDGKTVRVEGFDYSNKFVAENHPGQKLIVEVIVTANESAAGLTVPSNIGPANEENGSNPSGKNGYGAGVYERTKDGAENPVSYFPVPMVTIPKYAYVLDFGKKVTIPSSDEFGLASLSLLNSKPEPVNQQVNSLAAAFGTFEKADASLSYTPGKINWNGIDTAYTMGKRAKDNKNEWIQTKFIPATSVYYEDNFNQAAAGDGNIKIVYTGEWSTDSDGTDAFDEEQSYHSTHDDTEDRYGWDTIYTDDSEYSDGSAHKAVGKEGGESSKATFTFSGTGIDVYSRTNLTVGKIYVKVYKVNEDGTEDNIVVRVIDNLYESGDLYQIPTFGLDLSKTKDEFGNALTDDDGNPWGYGTYRVEIEVSGPVADHTGTSRSVYYLDGIRVYNPMGIDGGEAADHYTEDGELSPFTVGFRDILLDAENAKTALNNESAVSGSVFIDEFKAHENGDGKIILDAEGVKTFENYGPKNEVYLAPGQQIAFRVDQDIMAQAATDNTRFMIGLKDPDGAGDATVQYSFGGDIFKTVPGSISATDLYYEIQPDSATGSVVIKNTSDTSLLALTKLKITNVILDSTSFMIADQTLQDYTLRFNGVESTENTLDDELTIETGEENTTKELGTVEGEPVTEAAGTEAVEFNGNIEIQENSAPAVKGTQETVWAQVAKSVEKYFNALN